MRSRRNYQYLTFEDVPEEAGTLMKTQHHASLITLDFVVQNDLAVVLIWFSIDNRFIIISLHGNFKDHIIDLS